MRSHGNVKSVRKQTALARKKGKTIGFVPTMGYLHEGHVSLISKARAETDFVVVSIFVNPIQFGPKEDLKKYPRDFKRDSRICRENKVDLIFVPFSESIYGKDFCTYVKVEKMSETLCGLSRPEHFKGVTTVVAKLFNIVNPDVAYFGQKDAQQALIIKQMVKDLNMPVSIRTLPIIRDKDGLAMSSRNAYLSADQRKQALSIYDSLRLARRMNRKGIKDAAKIKRAVKTRIKKEKDTDIDYVDIVDPLSLERASRISGRSLLAIAVKIGRTRLIDNIILR